jgi:Holliday junction resolvase
MMIPTLSTVTRRRDGVAGQRRGKYVERLAVMRLTAAGYWTMRASASKGVVDVVAIAEGGTPILLCQVKSDGARLPPAEWNALYTLATQLGAVPLLIDAPQPGVLRIRRLMAARTDRSRRPLADYPLT